MNDLSSVFIGNAKRNSYKNASLKLTLCYMNNSQS